MNSDIKNFLINLIEFKQPLNELKKEFLKYNKVIWDNKNLLTLKKEHIINACDKFIKNKISSNELEDWADLVEGLDALEYDPKNSNQISEMLFQLSNPEINGELTKKNVKKGIVKMSLEK